MKVWITKYALTSGITEEITEDHGKDGMVKYGYGLMQHAYGEQWHYNRHEALLKAEEMRLKKITSLKKSIQRLESMNFIKGAP